MTRSFCLTVEVKSAQIENGLGYMVAFRLPKGVDNPDESAEFKAWAAAVQEAVLRAGDLPFNHDPYTKKVAISELMHELAEINKAFGICIGGTEGMPAVQIHSTNPFDNEIDIDLTDADGAFRVTERTLHDRQRAQVVDHGRTGVLSGNRKDFPFEKKKRPPSGPQPRL